MTSCGCGPPRSLARPEPCKSIVLLGGVEVCDRCFDRRLSAVTGLPRLPDPPPPIVIAGPDGSQHYLRYRVWRAGVGIEVQLEETGVLAGEGYRFAVLGDNDADVEALVAEVRSTAEAEIGRRYLERASDRHPWMVGDDGEVAGACWATTIGMATRPTNWSSMAGRSAGTTWPPPWSPTKVGAFAW